MDAADRAAWVRDTEYFLRRIEGAQYAWFDLGEQDGYRVAGYGKADAGEQGEMLCYQVSYKYLFARAPTLARAIARFSIRREELDRVAAAEEERRRKESDPAYIRHKNATARAAREHTRWLADMRELYDDPDCSTISCTRCGSALVGMVGQSKTSLRNAGQSLGWTKSSGRCPRCTYR